GTPDGKPPSRACLAGAAKRRRRVQRAVDEGVHAARDPTAGQRNQNYVARFARLEPQRRAGRNVQPAAIRSVAVESERGVDLEKMRMGTDLDRPIARVFDAAARGWTCRVQLHL